MIAIPEFSENKDSAVLLYFNADNADEKKLCDEIENTYVCFSRMTRALKNGHKYVVLEIEE